MVDVPMEQTGQGSGTQSTARQIGSALGIAVLGTLLFTGTQTSIDEKLANLDVSKEQAAVISTLVVNTAGSIIPSLPQVIAADPELQSLVGKSEAIQEAAGAGFTDGTKFSAWAAGAFLGLGFLSSFRLGTRTRKK
jgi:hypothetical protein